MELYVTRHGQSEWNALSKVCGRTDSELTEKGLEQARDLADRVVRYRYPVTRVICSPQRRAKVTAEYAAAALGVPCEQDGRLIEFDYGAFEGADRKSWDFLNSKRQLAGRYPGGESALQVACRVYGLLDELKAGQDTCLLVAHNGVCRVIHTYFVDLSNDDYFRFDLSNCEVKRYEFP